MIDKLVDEIKEAGTYEVEFSVFKKEKGDNQASGIRHPYLRQAYGRKTASSIRHRVSSIEHPVSNSLFCQMKAGDYLSEKEMKLVG